MHHKTAKQYSGIHFIGIGGIHMSGIAELLHYQGYVISGSDRSESETVKRLTSLGISIATGIHKEENVPENTELVIYTAAVKPDNPELRRAEAMNIELMPRAEFLGQLLKNYKYPICIAGTHGKTTTTSMIGEIFSAAGLDPTILTGGTLKSTESSLQKGSSEYFIVEACEYCDSFLSFYPYIGVILNIDGDHFDYFANMTAIRASFRKFAENINAYGYLIISSSISGIEEIVSGLKCKVITLDGENGDFRAENFSFDENGAAAFNMVYKNERIHTSLSVPGEHNVSNALTAIAAAVICGIKPENACAYANNYKGTDRRFEYKGIFNGVKIYDDYAHHPTEIRATLAAAENISGCGKWFIFQPHTHTRTKALLHDFADSLSHREKVIITDIYSPAGRTEEGTIIHSLDLVKEIRRRGGNVTYIPSLQECTDYIMKNAKIGDMVITMGAGDVYTIGEAILSN